MGRRISDADASTGQRLWWRSWFCLSVLVTVLALLLVFVLVLDLVFILVLLLLLLTLQVRVLVLVSGGVGNGFFSAGSGKTFLSFTSRVG